MLKPTYENTILGKRDWNLEQIRQQDSEGQSALQHQRGKKRKLARSISFSDEIKSTSASTQEKNFKSSINTFPNFGQKSREYQDNHQQSTKLLRMGRDSLDRLPTAENFEDLMVYNLRKTDFFSIFNEINVDGHFCDYEIPDFSLQNRP